MLTSGVSGEAAAGRRPGRRLGSSGEVRLGAARAPSELSFAISVPSFELQLRPLALPPSIEKSAVREVLQPRPNRHGKDAPITP